MGTPSNNELLETLEESFEIVSDNDETVSDLGSTEPRLPARRRSRQRGSESTARPGASPIGSSALPMFLGMMLLIASFLLAAAPLTNLLPGAALGKLASLGITPALLFIAGVLMTALAWAQHVNAQRSAREMARFLESQISGLRDEVSTVAVDARKALDRPAAPVTVTQESGGLSDELGQEISASLSKQDGMIANLTKAVRMHNKPLVDLVGMATEILKRHEGNEKALLAIKLDLEAIEKAMAESLTSNEKRWEGLCERLHGSENELEDALAKNREILCERIEPQITDESRRIAGDLEAQGDLLREHFAKALKDLETQNRDELQNLLRKIEGISVAGGSADSMAFTSLQENIDKLRVAVEHLDHRALASSSSSAPSTPAAAPAPAPAAKPTATTSGTTSGPATTTSTAAPATGGGKKTLSAIERLKQMRGG